VPFEQLDYNTYVPGQLIVGFEDSTTSYDRAQILSSRGATLQKDLDRLDISLAEVSGDLNDAAQSLASHPEVKYAEPNFVIESALAAGVFPDDPYLPQQWGLHNGGQVPGTGVTGAIVAEEDADIDAPEGWEISPGTSDVVIAIIDTGVDYTHPDLIDNMWVNPGEIDGDGIDNDGNGFIDDIYGADVGDDDGDPLDIVDGHGTHVAGIAAAVGDNGIGVAGVSWNAQIMAVKLWSDTDPAVFDAVEGIDYVTMMKQDFGVNVVVSNNSWGLPAAQWAVLYGGTQALEDAIQAHADAGIVFVADAGNTTDDNDLIPDAPSGFEIDGLISVAATDKDDSLASFSNYGRTSVDLAAPGVEILSTHPRALTPIGYTLMDGTSMSSPMVAGAVAVVRSVDDSLSVTEAKDVILGGVDPLPSLFRQVVTHGRLNLFNSLNLLSAGEIWGQLWNDNDSNGRMDSMESGLEGWTVFLDLDSDGRLDSGETSVVTLADDPATTSNEAGTYRLPNYFGEGTYTVSVKKERMYDQTFPAGGSNQRTVIFDARDDVVRNVDFAYQAEPGSVTGVVWNDEDGQGDRDPDEVGLSGWIVFADYDRDGLLDVGEPATLSAADGSYTLNDVRDGTAYIAQVDKIGWQQTHPRLADPEGRLYHDAVVSPGEENTSVDFGNTARAGSDFGDAPDPYPTLLEDDGARHGILPAIHLGPSIEDDPAGVGIDGEDGVLDADESPVTDDEDNLDDEDGVVFLTPLTPEQTAEVEVTVALGGNAPGRLQAWIDFNRDGDWSDPFEQIIQNWSLGEGTHTREFNVPSTAVAGTTYARFRYAYERDLSYTGAAGVGEVEDHAVDIVSDEVIATDNQFPVNQDSALAENPLNVLANDIPSSSGAQNLRILTVNMAGASGAATIDRNSTPFVWSDDFIRYAPSPGAFAPDIFTYTIEDVVSGQTDTATVSITVRQSAGTIPVAVDDSFTYSAADPNLDVLRNDRAGPNGPIHIAGFDVSNAFGTVELVSDSVFGEGLKYTPPIGFSGTDQFQYTIADSASVTDSTTVTIHVGAHTTGDLVSFQLIAADSQGNPLRIDQQTGNPIIGQGLEFQIQVWVDDVRGLGATEGVFSAYMDLLYDASMVSYAGDAEPKFVWGPAFYDQSGYHQNLDSSLPGILNEMGAFQVGPLQQGPQALLLATATYTANAIGTAVFSTDPADILPLHETSLIAPTDAPPVADYRQIGFGNLSVKIEDSPDLVQIALKATQLDGTPLVNDQVLAGSDFLIHATVEDRRDVAPIAFPTSEQGVFSAYLDVVYSSVLAEPVLSPGSRFGYDITFGPLFTDPTAGPINAKADFRSPGIINEVGAFQVDTSTPELFAGEELLFTVRFRAKSPPGGIGSLVFDAKLADDPVNEVTLIKPDPGVSVATAQVSYVDVPSITVIGAAGEGEYTNPNNPMDVNDDGNSSPMDVLILVNFLNQAGSTDLTTFAGSGEGESSGVRYYYDVNGDMMISPMDALGLINHLNSSAAQGVGGEGESRVDLSEAVIAAPVVVQTTDNETFPRFAVFQTGEPSDSAGDVIVDRPASLPDANRAAQPDGRHDASTFDDDAADELVDVDVILSDDMAEDIYAAWTGRGATGDLLAELL